MSKILIAEDDRNFGRVLRDELEEDGFTVDLVGDGVEVVLSVIEKSDAYDFVLMDIKMPKLNGINSLRIIKALNNTLPVITFSGNAGTGEMAESVRAGAIRCLTKPFDISVLKEEIRNHLARRTRV